MTDVRLSVAIMHAPWGGRGDSVARILDQLPTAVVVEDRSRDAWDTARRAWLAGSDATHHLVLQDDARLCDDFEMLVGAAVTGRPSSVISFFTPHLARASAVAIAMPSPLIAEWIAWADAAVGPKHDDRLLASWLCATERPLYRTSPSLVQHAAGDSLIGHRWVGAERFIQRPLVVGWDMRTSP